MSLKFGTSGLRGLSEDLKGRPAAVYATAFGRHLIATGAASAGSRILIGQDYRPSSPEIAATAAAALEALGFKPVDCGAVPTPALASRAMAEACGALMVTGSHIPADRNGIKFYRPDGEIDKADEEAIVALAAEAEADPAIRVARPVSFPDESHATVTAFMDRNRGLLGTDALAGWRIGVYQHSTVARDMFVDLLSSFGAQVVPLGRSDHFIPVDTEAVSPETLGKMKAWASEHGLSAIISTDGDGDRPLLADETGMPLRGDLLGLITARVLHASVVVTPVTSNSGIETAGPFETVRTRVGSPYVIAGMGQALAAGRQGVMGFEANGGLLTASPFSVNGCTLSPLPTRDCFLPTIAVLAEAVSRGMSLSALARAYSLPFADADRLENFPLATSAALMAHLRAARANIDRFLAPIGAVASVTDVDGLRVTLADGRVIHFRPSGNAPEMRCYVEAADEKAAKSLLAQGLALIGSFAQTHA